jgi:hypothetical protein
VALVAGCSAILGLDGPDGLPFPLGDAGNDAQTAPDVSVDAGASGPDECAHHTVPPPNGDDEPDASNNKVRLWIALRTVELAPDNAPGFDLDQTCTGFNGTTAYGGLPSCNGRGIIDPKDSDGGVDNALFSSMKRFDLPGLDPNRFFPYDKRAERGLAALLLLVYEYNGKANDAEGIVGFARASGIQTDEGCDGLPRGLQRDQSLQLEYDPAFDAGADARVDSTTPGDGGTLRFSNGFAPAWDGCDRWVINRSDITPGTNSEVLVPSARFKGYVSNYQLVVQDDGTFPLGDRLLSVAQRTMVGTLIPRTDDAGTLREADIRNFNIAGRIGLDDAIAVLGSFEAFGVQFCKSDTERFNQSAIDACNALDIARNRSLDNKGEPCDALSFGLLAKGTSAQVDSVQASQRFLPRPEARCEQQPTLDKECRIVDAGGN